MSNYKILLGITGSIAAYKSAYLISKLVQNGFDVKVAATEYALKFIGKATLEGLTGNKVNTDSFEEGEMMSHINLVKWADITVVCPASGNTINKLAAGIADNLLTSLFLAHDWTKPYLVVPAMNTNMFEHPATQESLKKLESWGVEILPTAEGYLACGDTGKGKLLDPDEIYERILLASVSKQKPAEKLNVLITAGGTKEDIDGIRYISNLSTGNTAAQIADYFLRRNHQVTYLHTADTKLPSVPCRLVRYNNFENLNEQLVNILNDESMDVIIHNAAVSDYSPASLEVDGKKHPVPLSEKLDSDKNEMVINLKKNPKIIDHLKGYSKNKNIVIVGFKFTNSVSEEKRKEAVKKLFDNSKCNFVVLNDKNDRDENNKQKGFSIYELVDKIDECSTSLQLAEKLETLLLKEK